MKLKSTVSNILAVHTKQYSGFFFFYFLVAGG